MIILWQKQWGDESASGKIVTRLQHIVLYHFNCDDNWRTGTMRTLTFVSVNMLFNRFAFCGHFMGVTIKITAIEIGGVLCQTCIETMMPLFYLSLILPSQFVIPLCLPNQTTCLKAAAQCTNLDEQVIHWLCLKSKPGKCSLKNFSNAIHKSWTMSRRDIFTIIWKSQVMLKRRTSVPCPTEGLLSQICREASHHWWWYP